MSEALQILTLISIWLSLLMSLVTLSGAVFLVKAQQVLS